MFLLVSKSYTVFCHLSSFPNSLPQHSYFTQNSLKWVSVWLHQTLSSLTTWRLWDSQDISDYGRQRMITMSMSIIVQQNATMYSLLYFCKLLYMFRVVTPPIIRSTYNCNYSIWHWSNFGKCSVWSQLKMRAIAEGSRDGSITLIINWLHTLHFPKFDQCQML